MNAALSYEEIVNYAGGTSCINEGQFIISTAYLFVAESLGYLMISPDAKRQLKNRFLQS